MISEIAREYRKDLNTALFAEQQSIGRGNAKDWNDYCTRVGRCKGLEDALNRFNDVMKAYLEEDD